MKSPAVSVFLYRLFMLACPPQFRREYREQMTADFEDIVRSERRHNGIAAAWLASIRAYADLLATGWAEYAAAFGSNAAQAWRFMAKSPGSSTVIIATLAIAIAANAIVFGFVNALILRPLPYVAPERLVAIQEYFTNEPAISGSSLQDSMDWAQRNRVFDGLAAYTSTEFVETGKGEPQRIEGMRVTSDYFHLAAVKPSLGRAFSPRDMRPGAPHVAVISDALWHAQFGAAPSAIGSVLRLNDRSFTVIGVAPAGFQAPGSFGNPAPHVWAAFRTDDASRGARNFETAARLRPGVSVGAAQADVDRMMSQLARQFPQDDRGSFARIVPLRQAYFGDVSSLVPLILGAMFCLLLIACANVANILLSHASSRSREVAVRLAVGGSRGTIVAQFLAESLLYSAVGGALGIALTAIALHAIRALPFPEGIRAETIGIDAQVVAFCFVIVALAAIFAGVLPAATLARTDLTVALKSAEHGSPGRVQKATRGALVVLQIVLAVTLVFASTLLVRSLMSLSSVDPGFDYARVALSDTEQMPRGARTDRERAAYGSAVLHAIRAVPDLRSAALIAETPLTASGGYNWGFSIVGQGRRARMQIASFNVVTPRMFDVFGLRALRGRLFGSGDSLSSQPVVVVNEAFAQTFFRSADALGRRLRVNGVSRRIVGVVPSYKIDSLMQPAPPQFFLPFAQSPLTTFSLVVRSGASLSTIGREVTGAWRSVDPEIPRIDVKSYSGAVSIQTLISQMEAGLFSALAIVALLLAATGVYAVMGYSVSQRSHEIGIRIALGAGAGTVILLVLRTAFALIGIGIAAGLVISAFAGRLLQSMLYSVGPDDVLTFAAVVVVIGTVGFVASVIPAARAARQDPVTALRYE
ncbi:MAG TPA: ABC transporter permease [Candidatus Baltobacteraceae bacterium]